MIAAKRLMRGLDRENSARSRSKGLRSARPYSAASGEAAPRNRPSVLRSSSISGQ